MRNIIFLLILVFGCMLAPAVQKEITAQGMGPSKREAIMSAQRLAIEKGVGVLVDSHSITENLEVVKDEIYSNARGYVKHFTIISESQGHDGNWTVVIKCDVAEGELKNNLRALGILRDKMGNPRIGVIYCDSNSGSFLPKNHPFVAEAYEGIVEHLTGKEFPIVANRTNQLRTKESAEYLLIYTVKQDAQTHTGVFNKVWVMISAKVIDTFSKQVLANLNKKAMGVDKDSADFAYRKAARKAGLMAAKLLEQKIVKRWQGETVAGRAVVLEIRNINDFSLLVELKAQLKEVYGVKHILQRQSTPNSARYDITYTGAVDTLKEKSYTILKQMGLKPGIPVTGGDRILFQLPPAR